MSDTMWIPPDPVDVTGSPGSLPMLQYTLTELFDKPPQGFDHSFLGLIAADREEEPYGQGRVRTAE